MKEYSVWFSLVRRLSKQKKAVLWRMLGGAEEIYKADKRELIEALPSLSPTELEALSQKNLSEAKRICEDCLRLGVGIIDLSDKSYPPLLGEIFDPPLLLYVRGTLPELKDKIAMGIVGQRKATVSGLKNASNIAYSLSKSGIIVVSGMAAGIDSASHKGALDGGSPTIAVFGTGIDKCYPVGNAKLMRRIIENGAVVSEYPPGAYTFPGNFLARNRIISGISRGVLVVEAKEKSGSLVTAARACEQNRDLFAIPGPIDSPDYVGTNRLIKDGAYVVTGAGDILGAYSFEAGDAAAHSHAVHRPSETRAEAGQMEMPRRESQEALGDTDMEILRAIGRISHIDDIMDRVNMDLNDLMSRLTLMELKGLVVQRPGNYFESKQ